MTTAHTCPRCAGALRAPTVWSSDWECDVHGAVAPYRVVPGPHPGAVQYALQGRGVPAWIPRPLPVNWLVTGLATAGDERTGARATAVALSGPNPAGGAADVVIVAEDPGVGLGARLAGLPGPDPGDLTARPGPGGHPAGKVRAAHHPTPLWDLATATDRDALCGEARGRWLWMIFWPAAAALLLEENLLLVDARDEPDMAHELLYGAPCPHLATLK